MVVFPTVVIGLLHGEFSLAKLQKTGALSHLCIHFADVPYI